MGVVTSLELVRLLQASDSPSREAAWDELIGQHTRLILAVARSFGGDHDARMERYAYVLEKLREHDFRRLRKYDSTVGATFSTWLTVTSRHLCLDYYRSQFGRPLAENSSESAATSRSLRRALLELTDTELTVEQIVDSSANPADQVAMRSHLYACLDSEFARLTPRERLLLTLRFEDDLPASRIASLLGFSTQFHVYRRLNSILKELRLALRSRGIDGPDG